MVGRYALAIPRPGGEDDWFRGGLPAQLGHFSSYSHNVTSSKLSADVYVPFQFRRAAVERVHVTTASQM